MSTEPVERPERRKRLLQIGSAAAFLAVLVVAVLIVVNQTSIEGGDEELEGVADVRAELKGLRQDGLKLGDPEAPVTLVEFGDLQCPACKAFSEEIVPQVIDSKVRSGQARIEFRSYAILGEESTLAGAAAVAAGMQGRGWDFIDLFYRNQGFEHSGYITDDFLTAVAEGAGVPDIGKWNIDRKSRRVQAELDEMNSDALKLALNSTPSFAVEGPGTAVPNGLESVGAISSLKDLEDAIDRAAGSS